MESILFALVIIAIGLLFAPIEMIFVYSLCSVKLRGSKNGYLQYYDEFLEIWSAVPCYEELEDGTLRQSLLECKTKEELEKYKSKFKTISDIKSFIEKEKNKFTAYENSKSIY